MFSLIKQDVGKLINREARFIDIFKALIKYKGVQAVLLYRLSNKLHRNNHKILAIFMRNRNIKNNGCDISEEAVIGSGLVIPHPVGIVIGCRTIIGNNAIIENNVTCGLKNFDKEFNPNIGDNVIIGTGSKILGDVTIGNNVVIGANSVVINNVADNETVAGIPAGPVKKSKKLELNLQNYSVQLDSEVKIRA